ncbi:MAG: hypothetical protein ABIK73_06000 [candidate division WOR-3 bacterium]
MKLMRIVVRLMLENATSELFETERNVYLSADVRTSNDERPYACIVLNVYAKGDNDTRVFFDWDTVEGFFCGISIGYTYERIPIENISMFTPEDYDDENVVRITVNNRNDFERIKNYLSII